MIKQGVTYLDRELCEIYSMLTLKLEEINDWLATRAKSIKSIHADQIVVEFTVFYGDLEGDPDPTYIGAFDDHVQIYTREVDSGIRQ